MITRAQLLKCFGYVTWRQGGIGCYSSKCLDVQKYSQTLLGLSEIAFFRNYINILNKKKSTVQDLYNNMILWNNRMIFCIVIISISNIKYIFASDHIMLSDICKLWLLIDMQTLGNVGLNA